MPPLWSTMSRLQINSAGQAHWIERKRLPLVPLCGGHTASRFAWSADLEITVATYISGYPIRRSRDHCAALDCRSSTGRGSMERLAL
jgi:hypothetical protein